MCWHKWNKWEEPTERIIKIDTFAASGLGHKETNTIGLVQKRTCNKCNIIEERVVKTHNKVRYCAEKS